MEFQCGHFAPWYLTNKQVCRPHIVAQRLYLLGLRWMIFIFLWENWNFRSKSQSLLIYPCWQTSFMTRNIFLERCRDVTTYQWVQGATICSLLCNSSYIPTYWLIFSKKDPSTLLNCLNNTWNGSRYEQVVGAQEQLWPSRQCF